MLRSLKMPKEIPFDFETIAVSSNILINRHFNSGKFTVFGNPGGSLGFWPNSIEGGTWACQKI